MCGRIVDGECLEEFDAARASLCPGRFLKASVLFKFRVFVSVRVSVSVFGSRRVSEIKRFVKAGVQV